jgi:DNA polymerase III subunit gamma/tau
MAAYQVLARKWRPQDFSSVVGQGPIVTALRNALSEGRIAQAYLFSGIRGVGKTTAARVLAKALNCENGPAADPCNECTSCREITSGADLDVIEVDAATYSKVEQVRDLTEGLKYGPARDRYKVVVIDEIHRLSRQAFDALLKIVEEPPPHVVFIFATTEIDAVPATVLSRCQEFHFRRVPSEEVAALLREISEAEGIEASDAALRLIARAGEGSVRDAVALLDQLATFGSGSVPDDEAMRLLGGLDTALFETLLGAIAECDRPVIAETVARVEDEGWDPRHVFAQFLAYCRDALHLAMGSPPERVDLPSEEAARLAERARRIGFENLLRLLQQLLASEATVRRSDSSILAVEIAWLRAAELPRLARVEEILSGGVPVPPAAGGPGPRSGSDSGPKPAPRGGGGGAGAPKLAPSASPARPARGVASPADGGAALGGFLERVGESKPPLAEHLRHLEDLRMADGVLEVVVALDDDLGWSRLERPANREIIDRAVNETWGGEASWRRRRGAGQARAAERNGSGGTGMTAGSGAPADPAAGRTPEGAEGGATQTEREVSATEQAVLDIFDGMVERVERDSSDEKGSE